ncbi:thiol-disulfide oxidoreductase [Salinivirga cyanobacteriivorans]|uniref:Thiol-disulfide oxidoreductase n=1 Tax=Salinivirga cyanobacteriivorans TaxID=1307839 RepID=A0A0S2HWR0_9BACT|nr:DUF4369 domain-containing protein [Salinivirga cyanobacteriivorans]ALO14461.1 thiol-disulfide oxidoreductase [Salinivirga cyanobacteriivorans]
MRSLIFIVLIVLWILPSCGERENFEIKGKVKGIDSAIVYLGTKKYESQYGINPMDSTVLRKGKFEFKGSVKIPQRRYIKIEKQVGSIPLFIENSEITIKTNQDKYPDAEIKGSKTQTKYERYIAKKEQYNDTIQRIDKAIQKAIKNDNQTKANNLQKKYFGALHTKFKYIEDYMLSDAPSVLRLFVYDRARVLFQYNILDSLYTSLDSSVYRTDMAKNLKKRIENLEKVQPGKSYINLTLVDTAGNKVSLSDYVGENYVLLYFTYLCPHMDLLPKGFPRLHEKYHEQGLQLFGVYADTDPFYWKNTIKKNNLKWPFVSDLKGRNSIVYEKYGNVNMFFHYLIDKDGKFIGKYKSTKEIEKELKKRIGR